MMYICNPDKNVECRKTGCLFYLGGECFSTLNEEFAVRNDGKPVSFPEEQYETMKEYIVPRWKKAIADALDHYFIFGTVKKVKAPGKVVDE